MANLQCLFQHTAQHVLFVFRPKAAPLTVLRFKRALAKKGHERAGREYGVNVGLAFGMGPQKRETPKADQKPAERAEALVMT